jgi:hypothetical protein
LNQISIQKYNPTFKKEWNSFVAESKNGTFLFHRDFMEYHNDRFVDYSLLVFENNKLLAILPANQFENTIYSHQGLTYGGLVYKELKQAKVITVLKEILFYLNQSGFEKLMIKSIPSIYHIKPAEELLYALFVSRAKLIRRDSLSVIDLKSNFSISKGRMEGVIKGEKLNLRVVEETKFDNFWINILIPNLKKKHNAKPVHSIEEIKYLHSHFPENIRQFNLYNEDRIVAGTTIFESEQVAHAQYISANEDKNELGSLDFLYHYLITNIYKDKKYLDFGISNEDQGKNWNAGLAFWKESFGASTIVQDFYELETTNYNLLDNVLI